MLKSEFFSTCEPTAEQAIARLLKGYHRIEIVEATVSDQKFVESGSSLGQAYKIEVTWKLAAIRYQYKPRGRWNYGYVGFGRTEKDLLAV